MKTLSQTTTPTAIPQPINLSVIVMGLLIIGVVLLALSGKKVPLLSEPRISLVVLIVLGMAMCTASGINRVAALNAWAHPLAIVGYVLGAAILLLAGAVFFNARPSFIASDQQALLWVVGLIAAKVLNTVIHAWLVQA